MKVSPARGRRARLLGLTLVAVLGFCATAYGEEPSPARFDDEGRMLRPEGYREWVFIGAPLTPNDMNNGKAAFPEFHHVYIDPASWAAFVKTGEFREGTVIAKELVSVGTKTAASGNGYFAGEFLGLEATVKDSKRFADEPGGWAYFRFTNEEAMGSGPLLDKSPVMPTEACNSCHGAAAKQDWVFTQHYPVLEAAKR